MGAARLFGHALADAVAEHVHALRQTVHEVGLAAREKLGHGVHPPGHLALHAHHLGQPLLGGLLLIGVDAAAPCEDREKEDEEQQRRPGERCLEQRDGMAGEVEQVCLHL